MHHSAIGPSLKGLPHPLNVGQIGLDEVGLRWHSLTVTGSQGVVDCDVVAGIDQDFCRRRAQVAGAAGKEEVQALRLGM